MAQAYNDSSASTLASGRKGLAFGVGGGALLGLALGLLMMALDSGAGGPVLHMMAGAVVGGLAGTLIGALAARKRG